MDLVGRPGELIQAEAGFDRKAGLAMGHFDDLVCPIHDPLGEEVQKGGEGVRRKRDQLERSFMAGFQSLFDFLEG
jgi:hypothetical protein